MTISKTIDGGWREWTLEEDDKHEFLDRELRLPDGTVIMGMYNNPMRLLFRKDAKELAKDGEWWCRPVSKQTMLDFNKPHLR